MLDISEFAVNTPVPQSQPKAIGQARPTGLRIDGRYIRTLSESWFSKAARLSPKTLAVGLAIWRIAGLTSSAEVKLTSASCDIFNVNRAAKRRGLRELEDAGLIRVISRQSGKNPTLRIIQTTPTEGAKVESATSAH